MQSIIKKIWIVCRNIDLVGIIVFNIRQIGKMYVFGGCSTKRKKNNFVAPAVVFTPLQPVTTVNVGAHPPVVQPLVHMWPSPLVILSQATPWAAQPPNSSISELPSVHIVSQKVLILPFFLFDYHTFPYEAPGVMFLYVPNDLGTSLKISFWNFWPKTYLIQIFDQNSMLVSNVFTK